MNEIKKIVRVLNKKQIGKLVLLCFMTIIGSLLELLGVSAILPFVNVATNPESVYSSGALSFAYELTGVSSVNQFMVFLAILLMFVYFVKNAYMIVLYNAQFKFTYDSQRILEGKLLSCYINQDYIFHLDRNSAELQRNVIQDVAGFFQSVLAYLQLMTEAAVCSILFVYLLFLDKTITLGVVFLLSAFLLMFYKIFKEKIGTIGADSRAATAKRVQWVQQSLGGIKEIKILGREHYFLNSYDKSARIYADRQKKYNLATQTPRPIMETLCVCSLLIIVAAKIMSGVDLSYFIPTLSVFAIAAFRLLPSFSRISGYVGTITFQRPAVDEVCTDIADAEKMVLEQKQKQENQLESEIPFEYGIKVENISFRYPDKESWVLHHARLEIPKNKSIAFIGPSGAGKTTMADVILGILKPQEGTVWVDNFDVFKHLKAWQNKLGYIPQSIYLMDDTLRNNIAFGVPEELIDDEKVIKVIKEAQLYEHFMTLEDGLDTYIGEGGVRLSGGQRQRIGIARALYNDPEILVLDEATSALDNETEKAIMEAINMLHGNKTLIIIAHRLTTIQNCDSIYEIRDGIAILKDKKDI